MAEATGEYPLVINFQYVKDLSFENPNAPAVFAAMGQESLELDVNIDVTPAQLQDRTYEIVLTIRVEAKAGDKSAFLVELDYAAVATVADSASEADLEPLLLAETPRHLFPFARSLLATVTRDGGFPPLVVNPIDFDQFYRRHKQNTLTPAPEAAAAPGA